MSRPQAPRAGTGPETARARREDGAVLWARGPPGVPTDGEPCGSVFSLTRFPQFLKRLVGV